MDNGQDKFKDLMCSDFGERLFFWKKALFRVGIMRRFVKLR